MGRLSMASGIKQGLIRVEGSPALVRDLAGWGLSYFADVEPAVAASR
jgi:hypothetical protein